MCVLWCNCPLSSPLPFCYFPCNVKIFQCVYLFSLIKDAEPNICHPISFNLLSQNVFLAAEKIYTYISCVLERRVLLVMFVTEFALHIQLHKCDITQVTDKLVGNYFD